MTSVIQASHCKKFLTTSKILKIQDIVKDIFRTVERLSLTKVHKNEVLKTYEKADVSFAWYNDKSHKGRVATPRAYNMWTMCPDSQLD